ncbi:MAG: DUF2842 domain-containing protein [Pseudomonadota bacterium]
MRYKTRKLLCALVLIVGVPAYIVVAVSVVGLFDRPPILLELVIYVALGILWAFPLKRLFKGIGQADPEASPPGDAQR